MSDVLTAFERLFRFFDSRHFSGLVMPTFRCDFRKKATFRFHPKTFEFVIGRSLLRLTHREALVDFLHEMIHIYNHAAGVVDHAPVNQYHNQRFASAAHNVGFHVLKHPTHGWSVLSTEPPARGDQCLFADDDDLAFLRGSLASAPLDLETFQETQRAIGREGGFVVRKVCQIKYVCKCPPPHNAIRSGRRPTGRHPLDVTCNLCHSRFAPTTPETTTPEN